MQLSLKWQIQLWYALILVVVLATLGTGFYYYEKSRRLSVLDNDLDVQVPPLLSPHRLFPNQRQTDRPPRPRAPENLPPRELEGWERTDDPIASAMRHPSQRKDGSTYFERYYVPRGYYARVIDKGTGELVYTTENFPAVEVPAGHFDGYHYRTREQLYREIFHSNPRYNIIVGMDLSNFQDGLFILRWQISGALFALFLMALGIGYIMVSRALRPLVKIEQTAMRIAEGKLGERIPESQVGSTREFVQLSDHLNETFSKLESLFSRQTRFTADASHELRTPLTALIAQLELGSKRSRSPEEYERILAVCMRSTMRIARITEQLIELSRYDSGRITLELTSLPLAGMLRGLTEELEAAVTAQGSRLRLELSDGLVRCDPFRIEQVITNLVNNAVQHNTRPITIWLRGRGESGRVLIEVADDGKGIQPENVTKLFDRFYQEESSHTKVANRENVGLGLSISQAIVEAHGGSITVKSTPEIETVFTVELPQ